MAMWICACGTAVYGKGAEVVRNMRDHKAKEHGKEVDTLPRKVVG